MTRTAPASGPPPAGRGCSSPTPATCASCCRGRRRRRRPAERGRAAGRAAARRASWAAVAGLSRADRRTGRATARHAAPDPAPLELDPARIRLLATPAWRGDDRLGELLAAWVGGVRPGTGACLFLLADPRSAPGEDACTQRVLDAAAEAGVSLDDAADIVILTHSLSGGDGPRLHAGVDGYVPLHDACAGHERLARAAGRPVLEPAAADLARVGGGRRATRRVGHNSATEVQRPSSGSDPDFR